MKTMMTARAETGADYITATADLIRGTAGLAADAADLVTRVMADPKADGLRHALAVLGSGLLEAAAAVRAQQPSVAMFAAVEHARQDQCRTCPLLRAQVVTLAPRQRARALSSS